MRKAEGASAINLTIENKAALACLYAGAVWGLFWIPLRALDDAGLHGLWVTVVYFTPPTLLLVPVTIRRWRHVKAGGAGLQLTAMISGGALLLYSASIIYTDVVRAILLFYLTPVWATILARIFLGDAITLSRIIAMVLALAGMLTVFGVGVRFPVPENAGDWMGLLSGVLWAVAMVRIRQGETLSALELTAGFFQWSLVFALVAALILAPGAMPSPAQTLPVLPLLLIFIVCLVLPGTLASLWGPKYLSPGVVGLLFMTEIIVGAVSVALLSDETLGSREYLGIVLIAGASLMEPLLSLLRARRIA